MGAFTRPLFTLIIVVGSNSKRWVSSLGETKVGTTLDMTMINFDVLPLLVF